ncbi:hypothetical protein BJY59DRAFT_331262 [Rhodotorula toruloides]
MCDEGRRVRCATEGEKEGERSAAGSEGRRGEVEDWGREGGEGGKSEWWTAMRREPACVVLGVLSHASREPSHSP